MTRDVITVAVTDSILDAMEKMVAKRVGRVIVTEKQVPVGIFTEQDVLKRVVNKKLDAKKTSIKKVMTAPIRAVHEEASIVDVLGNMFFAEQGMPILKMDLKRTQVASLC